MTYLELVNSVMRKLREESVSTVNESDYSRLIGDFVNDAKRYVEDSWDWTALREERDVTTVAGVANYSLSDTNVRSEILYGNNETHQFPIAKESLEKIRKKSLSGNDSGDVMYYAVEGVDSNNNLNVRVYPKPKSSETLKFYVVKRGDDLVDDADVVKVPASVVVHFAYSYALVERGETGGQSGAEQALFAKVALTDAITLDARFHSDELIWNYV